METQGSLPCTQEPTAGPYCEPDVTHYEIDPSVTLTCKAAL
jgi:hypothetical protein